MPRLTALLCLVGLVALASPAMAQTEIHRCIGANGGAVFTDQPCAALQATSVTSAPRVDALPSATPPPILCAASVSELRQSVIDAFASHDANRMAGMMLWNGYGRGAAIADIQSLTQWMKQPLVEVEMPGDPAAAGTDHEQPASAATSVDPFTLDIPPSPAPPGNQLVLHTANDDGGARDLRFDIVHRAGCLWLRNAN
ncbi:DUF4124 domain-containing protein [Rhodanobacter sp. Col0626]|uniref:DUF4124 domain-containing protein n=1 Tax=Rhodanobacter sp. Col0626 TaxID=3415679 RepID=UPI003CE6D34E